MTIERKQWGSMREDSPPGAVGGVTTITLAAPGAVREWDGPGRYHHPLRVVGPSSMDQQRTEVGDPPGRQLRARLEIHPVGSSSGELLNEFIGQNRREIVELRYFAK